MLSLPGVFAAIELWRLQRRSLSPTIQWRRSKLRSLRLHRTGMGGSKKHYLRPREKTHKSHHSIPAVEMNKYTIMFFPFIRRVALHTSLL
jgi:hypothetical protein